MAPRTLWIGWRDGETPEVIYEPVDENDPKGAKQYIQLSKYNELLEAIKDVIRNSHDILAKKRCSNALAEAQGEDW